MASAGPRVTALSAIIVDAGTGEVLWERDADTARPPASTTKVLTAIVALESGRLDEAFRVSKAATAIPPSKIHLRSGQRMELDHLLYAILLNSANDAAHVIAEGLGGSKAGFSKQMNAKAKAIGAKRSHFENPHGLTEKGHVATARDIATIFRYGLGIPRFRAVLGTRSIQVPVYSNTMRRVSLRSHNRLLSGWRYTVIGKTGYTHAARRCFVGSARHDDREVIIAFLGSSDLWGDARAMFDHTFRKPSAPATQMVKRAPAVAVARAETAAAPAPAAARAVVRAPAESAPGWVTAARVDAMGSSGDGERFTVRFGPFDDDHSVERKRQALAKDGYTPLVSGRALRLGAFTSRDRALHLAQRLRQSGYEPTVVSLY
jgi:D-alanyl-D-alanine carboxypeptidase (penicillin-binding protein 5/6)